MADFKIGLCGCFDNCFLCCLSNCLAPVTITKIAENIGESHPVAWALGASFAPPCAIGLLRTRIREREGIEGAFCADCCTTLMFEPCVLNQLTVETGVLDPLMPQEQRIKRVAPS